MGIPSADEQVRFLRDVQALLEDGQFVEVVAPESLRSVTRPRLKAASSQYEG